jgi:hypothetical protein
MKPPYYKHPETDKGTTYNEARFYEALDRIRIDLKSLVYTASNYGVDEETRGKFAELETYIKAQCVRFGV